MKQGIQRLLNSLGYRISRMSVPTSGEDPFTAMQRLLTGNNELIIFDVGAHHGQVSKDFRRLFPSSMVYSFEPFQDSFEHLKANTALDSRIKAFNFGLSDKNGTRSFHSNASSETNSLLPTDELGTRTWGLGLLETQQVVKADFKTIDSVLETLQIPRIDILKLDVQGAEPLVMEGGLSACRMGSIRLVYSEIITQPAYTGQKRFDEVLSVFYKNGFDLYNIYNMCFTPEGRLCQVDAIFTKST